MMYGSKKNGQLGCSSHCSQNQCLVPTVKHGGRSAMNWEAVSWYTAGPIITPNGLITVSDYVDILGILMHPMVQMLFPNNDAIFQDDNSPIHTSRSLQS